MLKTLSSKSQRIGRTIEKSASKFSTNLSPEGSREQHLDGIIKPKLEFEPYDDRNGPPIFKKEMMFRDDKPNFGHLRVDPRFAYFDRTRYITAIESLGVDVRVFLRPHQFGKSLFLSTLAHFHGVEHKHNYAALFQGLDVDKDVQNGFITPGEYFILHLDFSLVQHTENLEASRDSLGEMINNSIKQFYIAYASYLGNKTSKELIDREIKHDAISSFWACNMLVNNACKRLDSVKGIYLLADDYDVFMSDFLGPKYSRSPVQLRGGPYSYLRCLWANVKAEGELSKCFITGLSPLSNESSGFNISANISWYEEVSGLCGLTEEDVLTALRLPGVCKTEDEVQNHFYIMKINYGGYKFVERDQGTHVFNTGDCLEYLQSLMRGNPINPRDISSSVLPESTLGILAASPAARDIFSDHIKNHVLPSAIPENFYFPLQHKFDFTNLASHVRSSWSTWQGYMLYVGALTYSCDGKQLAFTNPNVAERFGNALFKAWSKTDKL